MAFDEKHIQHLWERYLSKTATPEEVRSLFALFGDPELEGVHDRISQALIRAEVPTLPDDAESRAAVWQRINEERKALTPASLPGERRVHFLPRLRQASGGQRSRLRQASGDRGRKWGWAAASVILVLGMGAYLWTSHKKNTVPPVAAVTTGDIAPGRDGAILTLADGSQLVLDSLGNGVIANQKGTKVMLDDGRLAYDPAGAAAAGEVMYNTMSTPKGRQFQLLLPDGTRVWLNAASSIRYPTVFSGKERKVEVTGEAYFEVAKNTRLPFRAQVNNIAEVEVLGTSFNVNAYEDEESINTTLIEGSVRVNGTTIKPGQQAQIAVAAATGTAGKNASLSADRQPSSSLPAIKLIDNADIEKVLAWKNGAFNFDGAGLEEVMRQLERWYDLKVVYEGPVPKIQFFGEISRNENLSSLLKALEESKVHCRMEEGRRLIVLQ